MKGDGNGPVISNGVKYYDLATWGAANIADFRGVKVDAVPVASAAFAQGTVENGSVTQFVVVPEPSTLMLGLLCGLSVVAWRYFRRAAAPR